MTFEKQNEKCSACVRDVSATKEDQIKTDCARQ